MKEEVWVKRWKDERDEEGGGNMRDQKRLQKDRE